MSIPEFEALEPQEARDYWAHEAQDFTPWLADQLDADGTSQLEDVLELDLDVLEREKRVGKYSIDLYAEIPEDNRKVVIENQLSDSDHDHLGKTIAYAAGVDADIIVWIAPKFNDEHRDAFQWLNNQSREGVDLFALRLEVWRIGDSKPAVRLNPVVEPSEWKETLKESTEELTETKRLQKEFWTAFRDRIDTPRSPLSPRKPKAQHWYNNPVGKTGFTLKFKVSTKKNRAEVGLLIRDDEDAYYELERDRAAIEAAFDSDIEWQEPWETSAGKYRSQIICTRSMDLQNRERWDEYLDWLVTHGEKFREEFGPRVAEL